MSSLPVMLGTLAICLGAAWLYGRLLGVPGDLRTLIGVGTGICGGSAIAAVSPVIEAASTDVAYAISTIFLFNIAAVLVFPLLGHALGMSQQSFGLFAGTAVNDTSSVVATATTYGAAATSHAVVVKLVRTLMIIPICLGLATLTERKRRPASATADAAAACDARRAPPSPRPPLPQPARMSPRRVLKLVPWFLIGFVLVAAVNSAGIIPAGAHAPSSTRRCSSSRSRCPRSACPPTWPRCARPATGRCCSAPCYGSPSPRPAWASRHSPAPCDPRHR